MTRRRADGNSVLAIIEPASATGAPAAPAGQEIPGRQVLLEARQAALSLKHALSSSPSFSFPGLIKFLCCFRARARGRRGIAPSLTLSTSTLVRCCPQSSSILSPPD